MPARLSRSLPWGLQSCSLSGACALTAGCPRLPAAAAPAPDHHDAAAKTLPPKTLPPKALPPKALPPKTLPPKTLPPKTLPTLPPKTLPTLPPKAGLEAVRRSAPCIRVAAAMCCISISGVRWCRWAGAGGLVPVGWCRWAGAGGLVPCQCLTVPNCVRAAGGCLQTLLPACLASAIITAPCMPGACS